MVDRAPHDLDPRSPAWHLVAADHRSVRRPPTGVVAGRPSNRVLVEPSGRPRSVRDPVRRLRQPRTGPARGKAFAYVADWSADGRFLLYEVGRAGNPDLWILPFDGDRTPYTFLSSPARETQGQFSPDATWIAYTSDESGSPEVYVRRFPYTGTKWRISTHGGAQGRWRHDGKELFYLALDGRLMAVDVKASSSSFDVGAPHALFVTGITGSFVDRFNQYVVTRDGQRFLVNRSAEDENSAPITVVMNWDAARQ